MRDLKQVIAHIHDRRSEISEESPARSSRALNVGVSPDGP
jgi:hypothetical protein